MAQNGHVVQVDAGDDRTIRVHDVDRVQPPAQAHLQNYRIQRGAAHQPKDGQGAEFEIGQADLAARGVHRGKSFGQIGRRGRLPRQAAALLEMHQVRRGVNAGFVTGFEQDGFEHGAGRALAIGARHRDHRAGKAQLQPIGHLAHPIQPHVDGHRMQALTKIKPVL